MTQKDIFGNETKFFEKASFFNGADISGNLVVNGKILVKTSTGVGVESKETVVEVGTGVGVGSDQSINTTGIITASAFVGDGSGLTDVTAVGSGVAVQEEGSVVGSATTINFVGSAVTATFSGGVATIEIGDSNPTGTVIQVAMNSAPSGYVKCDGAAISRTTFSDLFDAIGTTWGAGDGSSTFNVPDLRGEFVRGWDDGKGTDSGRAFASSQSDATDVNGLDLSDPGHTHSVTVLSNTTTTNATGARIGGQLASSTIPTSSETTGITITSSDSETRPRNIALLYCIKT
jgi:microcystin-dependent protein